MLCALTIWFLTTFRKITVVELEGRNIVPSRSTFVSLGEGEYNVPTVAAKVSESLNTNEEMVLIDSSNQEIQDCPATQGEYKFRLFRNRRSSVLDRQILCRTGIK